MSRDPILSSVGDLGASFGTLFRSMKALGVKQFIFEKHWTTLFYNKNEDPRAPHDVVLAPISDVFWHLFSTSIFGSISEATNY